MASRTRARAQLHPSSKAPRRAIERFHFRRGKLEAERACVVEVGVGMLPVDLSRGEAELAIRTPRPRQAGLTATRLGVVRVGLYASQSLLAGKRLWVESAASLKDLPLLAYTPQHRTLQQAAWFQPVLAAAKLALRTNNTHTLLGAARAGLGVAVFPRFVARAYDDLVPVSEDVAARDMWLVSHPEFRRDARVRAVLDFLRTAARNGRAARAVTSTTPAEL